MKRLSAALISLSLLLLLSGVAQAAPMTVNLIGKWEGTAQAYDNQKYIASTPVIIRIPVQTGPLFYGTISFPKQTTWGDGKPMNFNGAISDGQLLITVSGALLSGKFHPVSPPNISGCFQHSPNEPGDVPITGVFVVKRTSTNPN